MGIRSRIAEGFSGLVLAVAVIQLIQTGPPYQPGLILLGATGTLFMWSGYLAECWRLLETSRTWIRSQDVPETTLWVKTPYIAWRRVEDSLIGVTLLAGSLIGYLYAVRFDPPTSLTRIIPGDPTVAILLGGIAIGLLGAFTVHRLFWKTRGTYERAIFNRSGIDRREYLFGTSSNSED